MEIRFDHVIIPHGAGRVLRNFGEDTFDFINRKPSFLNPKFKFKKKNDERCLPYALIIGKAYVEGRIGFGKKRGHSKYQRNYRTLRSAADFLCKLGLKC